MNIASVADMKAYLNTYLEEGNAEPAIIIHDGKPAALLVNVVDEDEIDSLPLAHSPKFRAIVQATHEEILQMGDIPHDEFWEQIDKEQNIL